MMHMEHRLVQTQTQQLVLTQKMQQALHILQLSGLELDQYVREELETNPFLEQVRKKEELPASAAQEKAKNDDGNQDEPVDFDDFRDRWRREGQDLSRNSDLHARRQFYEDSITQEESLRAHLLSQMRMAAPNNSVYLIGERLIIGDIDPRGYFTGDVVEIAEELEVTVPEVEAALDLIKGFEPTGVGARDAVECLLLQIQAEYPEDEELRILVQYHLDDLAHRQIPKIAKAMNITSDRVEELKRRLSTLNPWPGHEFASEPLQYIVPEVLVEKVEGEYQVRLMDERVPELRINDQYQKTLKQQDLPKEDREFVRGKIESARWLTRNITQRQQTILRVAEAIVRKQKDFLDKGAEHFRPLKLQDIAEVVGVHESTVARTTRGKYMQTPQGLFELKYFFSPGLSNDNGTDTQSSKSVQFLVKRIIDAEDKRKPLSDQKIADMLKKQGITVARRTVTKYRESMDIASTTMRREYTEGHNGKA
jgi:RNA polymerase sigma-54 factor